MPLSLLLLLAASHAAQVDLATDSLLALRPPEPPIQAVPGPRVLRRDVALTPADGGLFVRAVWILDAVDPSWQSLVPIAADAHVTTLTWQGRDLAGVPRPAGLRATIQVHGPGELVLEAFVPGDPARAPMVLRLAPAPLGTVTTGSLALADAVQVDGTWWTGAGQLTVAPPAAVRRDQGTLAVAHAGVGLTVREDAVIGRARMVWELRQGELDRVSFTLPGAGRDLDVTGVGLREWTRSGDRVTAILQAPATGRVVLEARWTRPIPRGTEAAVPVPALTLEGALRADVALQIARDGELEVLPDLPRWDPIPRSALPEWGQDLVEGTPTATYLASSARSGKLQLLRFVPVAAPAVVVDVAAHTVAASVEGRVLGRSLYQVRNERASHLRVALPPGARLVGVRVGPRIATPVSDGDDSVLVPLLRSVETLQGLITFPVEVIWLREDVPWDDASQRTLALPTVDAPVGVERTTVHLPVGFRDAGRVGDQDRVETFSEGEGITYGFATGDTQAVVADQLFQSAVTSWLGNDFDEAQLALEDLRGLGAESEDIDRLQSNLDLLFDEPATGEEADKNAERRIKAQARARSGLKVRAQKEAAQEAEKAERKGDYGRAEELYKQALELGEELEVLEEEESVEQSSQNSAYSANLAGLDQKKKSAAAATDDSWWQVEDTEEAPGFLEVDEDAAGWLDVDGRDSFELAGQVIGGEHDGALVTHGVGYGAGGSAAGHGSSSVTVEGRAYGGMAAAAEPEALASESRRGGRSYFLNRRQAAYPDDSGVAALPPPQVTASALSVTIPAAGQAVHYQRLLLPAGATSAVVLDAERARTSRRSR